MSSGSIAQEEEFLILEEGGRNGPRILKRAK